MIPNMEKFLDVEEEVRKFLPPPKGFASKAIHYGQDPEQWESKAMVPPIVNTVAFKLKEMGNPEGWNYSRTGNPTRGCLEKTIAGLDDAKYALAYASGLGAMTTFMNSLHSGDHVIACYDIYGSTYHLFKNQAKNLGIESDFVDFRDLELFRSSFKANTKVVWMESATNPLLRVFDIEKLAAITHAISSEIIFVVDNTFLTPYFVRPLNLGADIVLYSLSKFTSGHGDLISGVLTTNREDLYKELRLLQMSGGVVPSPYDCFLVQRSLKTLDMRMTRHFRNGLSVAKFLESHPRIEKVVHPGLKSHPEHELATRQFSGHSGMIAFYIRDADLEESRRICHRLRLITVAAGLGDIESSITIPLLMSSSPLPKEDLEALGITENLIRLSVGCESPEDLIEDLHQALS